MRIRFKRIPKLLFCALVLAFDTATCNDLFLRGSTKSNDRRSKVDRPASLAAAGSKKCETNCKCKKKCSYNHRISKKQCVKVCVEKKREGSKHCNRACRKVKGREFRPKEICVKVCWTPKKNHESDAKPDQNQEQDYVPTKKPGKKPSKKPGEKNPTEKPGEKNPTKKPATPVPTAVSSTTESLTTDSPTTEIPTTAAPSTQATTHDNPMTTTPTTPVPTTLSPMTESPTTIAPSNLNDPSLKPKIKKLVVGDYREPGETNPLLSIDENLIVTITNFENLLEIHPVGDTDGTYFPEATVGLAGQNKSMYTITINVNERIDSFDGIMTLPPQGAAVGIQFFFNATKNGEKSLELNILGADYL